MHFGPDHGPVVIVALPLFEEANRTRAFVVTVLRALAERGVASVLPDLPGTGDSLMLTGDTTIMAMRDAYQAVAESVSRPVYGFGVRSGALLDTLALLDGRYHLTPVAGSQVLRELKRVRYSDNGGKAPPGDSWIVSEGAIEIAGNVISPTLLGELRGVLPFTGDGVRLARLESDVQPADVKFTAAPLWRRAEPDNDPALAVLVAEDIAQWIAACAA